MYFCYKKKIKQYKLINKINIITKNKSDNILKLIKFKEKKTSILFGKEMFLFYHLRRQHSTFIIKKQYKSNKIYYK